MISELLKHSTNKELLLNVPEHLRDVHKARKRVRIEEQGVMLPPPSRSRTAASLVLWDECGGPSEAVVDDFEFDDEDLDGIDLS
jgi:hypothetical protein